MFETTDLRSADAQLSSGSGLPGATPSRVSPEERLRRIEEAAYYYSLRRGNDDDKALEDWIQAEADVDKALAAPAGAEPPIRRWNVR